MNQIKMISVTQEDYLRALYHLWEENCRIQEIKQKEHAIGTKGIKSAEVAIYLHVTKPSVSKMMNELAVKGYVHFERYGRLRFTPKGKKLAEEITAKHRIIEIFLVEILEIRKEKIHGLAHKLEHAFDDECVERLKDLLKHPDKDPHGKPIPPIRVS
ncbi:metal-dependent transcriptional regulator [Candidatus Woesearchaeota archaeon]|nr:metal-dependent transcriptional regulator [Candidatus Woesearchaeota archaeon]